MCNSWDGGGGSSSMRAVSGPGVWDSKEHCMRSQKLRSTSNPTSKGQVGSPSLDSTDTSMGCLSRIKPNGLSHLRKALVELDRCLCWSWKTEMSPTLAIPNLAKPHPLSYVMGSLKVWTTTFQGGPFSPAWLSVVCSHR